MNFDKLADLCTMQDHWLSFDLNVLSGTYRIGRKTFHSMQKAADEVDRLTKQRMGWTLPARAA